MQIDHVLYGVRDLDEAGSWFETTFGLSAVSGGEHPGWGTANAILPVGNAQYIELIGVVDPAFDSPVVRVLTSLLSAGDRPVAVCLRSDDLDAAGQRLQLDVTEGVRENPGGVTLRWRMAGLEAALGAERLPFFIEWRSGAGSPELDDVTDSVGDGVEWVELGGDASRLNRWVGADVPSLRAVSGPPGIQQFSIRRRGESIVLGPR